MAKTPHAGLLFFKVAFDKRIVSDDGAGNEVSDWEEQFTYRAGYTHLRGGETVMASRLQGKHTQVITARVSSRTKAVTTDWRVRDVRTGAFIDGNWTGKSFNIRDITPNLDRQFIDFLVEDGVANG